MIWMMRTSEVVPDLNIRRRLPVDRCRSQRQQPKPHHPLTASERKRHTHTHVLSLPLDQRKQALRRVTSRLQRAAEAPLSTSPVRLSGADRFPLPLPLVAPIDRSGVRGPSVLRALDACEGEVEVVVVVLGQLAVVWLGDRLTPQLITSLFDYEYITIHTIRILLVY